MLSWNKALQEREPISKLYTYHKSDGTAEMLATSQQSLKKVVGSTLTDIVGSLESDNLKFLTYKDRNIEDAVLIADGGTLKVYSNGEVSEVQKHVPTTDELTNPGLNDMPNLTKFRTFALKKDRIFAAANEKVKNRVNFCYFDPYLGYAVYDYWPAIYFFDVATEDNDEIVELKVFRDTLVIFCKRSVWALKGDGATLQDYELIKINVPNGCISPESVKEVGDNLFYLGDDHIYSLFSTDQNYISAQVVSHPIQPLLKSIGLTEKKSAIAIYFDNQYFLSFPSGLTLVYDNVLECWTKYTGIQANSFLVLEGKLYFSSNEGYIYRFNENLYSDDGRTIPFLMKTKLFDFEAPVQTKKIRRLWLIQKQWSGYESSIDLFASLDEYALMDLKNLTTNITKDLGGIWDESFWDDALWDFSEVMQLEIKFRQKGRTVQLQISNGKANQPVTIYGIGFEYTIKKP